MIDENDLKNDEYCRFCLGDNLAFRQIFDRYHQQLYSYAFAVNRCDFGAEEVVQEAFIQLFKSKHKIVEHAQIYPFLFVVVKRLLIQSFRKKLVANTYQEYCKNQWEEALNTTEIAVHYKDLGNMLQIAMNKLSKNEREVYSLNKMSGMSYEEIAKSKGISKNTVKNQIIAASKKIKSQIEKYYPSILTFFYINLYFV